MNPISLANRRAAPKALRLKRLALCMAAGAAFAPIASQALEFDLGRGVKLNWDTNVKYSAAYRLRNPSDALLNEPANAGAAPGSITSLNQDDGNRNFNKGLINNRFDLFTEADFSYQGFGARVSAAGWYDSVYNRGTDNTSVATTNHAGNAANQFPQETRRLLGRKTDLLDAFVFGKFDLGGLPLTFRAGRHTLYWGETFFFSNNGVAGSMGPIDAVKALSVPGSLSKEIFRPTGQVSGQLQLTPAMALGAYYQYKWERTVIPPAGSYFSQGDILDDGGYCIRFAPGFSCDANGVAISTLVTGVGLVAPRLADMKPKNGGQGGVQFKLRDETFGVDYGLYATVSHAKTPNVLLVPGAGPVPPVGYQLAYHQNIRTYGVSASKNVGDYQLATEWSTRRNTPLASDGQFAIPGLNNNGSNPAYPVGNTAHANVSVLATLPSNFLARSTSLTGEIAWNRTLSVTGGLNDPVRNPAGQGVNAFASRDAMGLVVQIAPSYTQVVDGLDIDVPLTVGYTLYGKSSAVPGFGAPHTGNYSLGLKGTYLAVWNLTLTYTQFYGASGNATNASGQSQFKQSLKDRQFLSMSVGTTF